MNKTILFMIIGVLVGCLIIMGINLANNPEKVEAPKGTNYIGLMKLGLAPSAPSREILEDDFDTGIKLTDGKDTYSLIKSNTFTTKDYGKTFLHKIE